MQYAEKKRQNMTMTSFSPGGTSPTDVGATTTKSAKEMAAELSNTMLEQVCTVCNVY